jgi:ankyrin repeat protein
MSTVSATEFPSADLCIDVVLLIMTMSALPTLVAMRAGRRAWASASRSTSILVSSMLLHRGYARSLYAAVKAGRQDVVQILLQDIGSQKKAKKLLSVALMFAIHNQHGHIVRLLLHNVTLLGGAITGRHLSIATCFMNQSIFQMLIDHVNRLPGNLKQHVYHNAVVHCAFISNDPGSQMIMRQTGENTYALCNRAVLLVARRDDAHIVKMVLSRPLCAARTLEDHGMALVFAALNRNIPMVRMLLKYATVMLDLINLMILKHSVTVAMLQHRVQCKHIQDMMRV